MLELVCIWVICSFSTSIILLNRSFLSESELLRMEDCYEVQDAQSETGAEQKEENVTMNTSLATSSTEYLPNDDELTPPEMTNMLTPCKQFRACAGTSESLGSMGSQGAIGDAHSLRALNLSSSHLCAPASLSSRPPASCVSAYRGKCLNIDARATDLACSFIFLYSPLYLAFYFPLFYTPLFFSTPQFSSYFSSFFFTSFVSEVHTLCCPIHSNFQIFVLSISQFSSFPYLLRTFRVFYVIGIWFSQEC